MHARIRAAQCAELPPVQLHPGCPRLLSPALCTQAPAPRVREGCVTRAVGGGGSAALAWLWPHFALLHAAYEQRVVRVRVGVAILERVAGGHRQQAAVVAERHRRNAGGEAAQLRQPLLVGAIPGVDHAVPTAGGKRPQQRVEGYRVHGEHDILPVLLPAVALEGVFVGVRVGRRVKVLHRHPPLDGAQCKASAVGIGSNAPCLELQGRLPALLSCTSAQPVVKPTVLVSVRDTGRVSSVSVQSASHALPQNALKH